MFNKDSLFFKEHGTVCFSLLIWLGRTWKTAGSRNADEPQWHKISTTAGFFQKSNTVWYWGQCHRPSASTLRSGKTWLFSFLCVRFPSYVITPVISITQPLQPSQHKCTTVTWNWVKKENILAHKILLGGVSVCFRCSKCTLQKKRKRKKKAMDCPEGLILSVCCQWNGWVGGPGNAAQITCLFTLLGCKW